MAEPRKRLTREDWVAAGLIALVEEGPEALKAERLSRRIGTTKGSFYWHFKDVPDFHRKLLSSWEAASLSDLAGVASIDGSPTDRLTNIGDYITRNMAPGTPEAAVRAWALSEPEAEAVIAEVDKVRYGYLSAVLAQLSMGNPELARVAYAAYIGLGMLAATDGADNQGAISTLMAAMLALNEA